MKIIEKLGIKFRELWNSPYFLDRAISAPYIFLLHIRGKTARDEPPLVRCGTNAYYLGINKCGNSTIRTALEGIGSGQRIYLGGQNKIKRLNKNNFFFTFVRNPYSRILSAYTDKIKRQASAKYVYKFNGVLVGISGKNLSFEDFIKIIVKIPDRLLDLHLKSYCGFIRENNLNMDFVGKLENFQEDWTFISTLFNLKDSDNLKVKNKTTKNIKLADYYTPELKEMVYEKYKEDFERFGYKK